MQQASLPGFDLPVPEVHNLFFALLPDAVTRARIAAAADGLQRRAGAPRGRWLKPERYHLTLSFLGEHARLPPDLVGRAVSAASDVRAAAFDLELDRAGSFAGNARIPCWFGCRAAPTALQALFDDLSAALRRRACRVVGAARLVPHVTVLRDADRGVDLALDAAIAWHVEEFVLIDSQTQPFQPYRILGRWPLR